MLTATAVIMGSLFVWLQQRSAYRCYLGVFSPTGFLGPLLAGNFITFGTFLAITVLTPVYFQVALGTSVSEAGLLMILVLVSTSVTSIFSGRYCRHFGRYKLPPLLSLPFAVTALAVLAFIQDQVSPSIAAAWLTLVSLVWDRLSQPAVWLH